MAKESLDGSRICQESIEQTICTKNWLDGKKIYRESVEKLSSLKKRSFSREEKHIQMNATSKLLKQRSTQYVKLSKHLSTNKQSIHRSKTHTHTHTHTNKSNQFYISKTS